MASGGSFRRDQRHAQSHTAMDLLLTHGYGATSIEAIARRARVSKRTFYHRFPDKPALTSAVIRDRARRIRRSMETSPAPRVGATDWRTLSLMPRYLIERNFAQQLSANGGETRKGGQ